MAFKLTKYSYKSLRKMNIQDRLAVAQDREMGQWLLSLLSPSQFVELFPDYYRRGLPDISGFLKAMPSSMSAAKQAAVEEQLKNTASGSAAGANFKAGGWRKKWQEGISEEQRATPTRAGVVPPPQFSPEQRKSFDDLKSSPMAVDDPRAKMFTGLTEQQLSNAGISKYKEGGKEFFKYTAPSFSEEEVKKSLSKSEQARSIERVANKLGIPPKDLAAVMHYESAGSMSTSKWGGTGGNYLGLIQFGPAERKQFGVYAGQPFDEQAEAAGKFLEQRGLKRWLDSHPNATQEEKRVALYSTINAGRPDEKYWTRSDNGGRDNVITHTQRIFREHYGAAERFMGKEGPAGDYSEKSMALARERLTRQEEERRIGSLAQYTTATPSSPGEVGPAGETHAAVKIHKVKDFSEYAMRPGVDNFGGQCGQGARMMAGHMYGHKTFISEGLGGDGTAGSLSHGNNYFQRSGFFNAAKSTSREELTNQAYLDSLPVGTVITSSGGRAGGDHGQGHAQIKIGPNKWASDTVQSHLLINGSHGNAYNNFMVHVPNEAGLTRLKENGVEQSVAPTVAATSTVPKDLPSVPSNIPGSQQIPPQQVPDTSKPPVPTPMQPAPQVETPEILNKPGAAVEPPKPAAASIVPERYNVNIEKFTNAIRQTEDFKKQTNLPIIGDIGSSVSNARIISGFNDDERVKAAGVHLDEKGIMHFTKGMTPEAKEAMSTFDTKSFMTKIEEKKKEEKKPDVKPVEQKPVEKPAEKSSAPTPMQPAPQVETPKVTNKPEEKPATTKVFEKGEGYATIREVPTKDTKQADVAPAKVKTNATGGTNKVNTEQISAYPIGGIKSDNVVVVNKQQQPLFTMNTNESVTMNPKTDTATVQPNAKERRVGEANRPSPLEGMFDQFNQSVRELSGRFDANKPVPERVDRPSPFPPETGDWLNNLNKITENEFHSPSARRAFYRAGGAETGEPHSGFHYSHGNRS